jgi:hypothetical protein
MNIPDEVKDKVVDAFRRAVKAQTEQWDAEREIEKLLGAELDTTDLVLDWASGCDKPEDAMSINADEIIQNLSMRGSAPL